MIQQHLLYRYLSIFCILYVGVATLGETGSYERAVMAMLSDTSMWILGMFSVISVYGTKE
jgi:hypothetical protein